MKNVYDLVGGPFQIEYLCKYLCDKYRIGKYKEYIINLSSDDNFNFALISEKGKYFVKIFNIKYNEKFAHDYVSRYMPFDSKPWVKVILDNDDSKVTKLRIDDDRVFYICVMGFIEGKRLEKIEEKDIATIVNYMVELSKQKCDIDIMHNKSSFIELESNLEEYGEYLPEKVKEEAKYYVDNMKKIKYRNLKKMCIHNSLTSETILKEEENLYLVSFSHSGYGYRLLDLISVMNSLIYDGTNLDEIAHLWNVFMSDYKKEIPLTVEESKNFDLLFKADCLSKLIVYYYNYKVKKNKQFKVFYKEMKKLLKFLEGKEIRV